MCAYQRGVKEMNIEMSKKLAEAREILMKNYDGSDECLKLHSLIDQALKLIQNSEKVSS